MFATAFRDGWLWQSTVTPTRTNVENGFTNHGSWLYSWVANVVLQKTRRDRTAMIMKMAQHRQAPSPYVKEEHHSDPVSLYSSISALLLYI